MMPSWATARHSGLPPTASEIPSCRLGLAGSIAVITRIDAKALAGLALAQRQQRAQGLADGGVGVLREDDAPAGLGQVLGIDALADAEVLGVFVALLVAQLGQVLGAGLAADQAGQVRGRHRRQGVVAGVAVDAVEVEKVVAGEGFGHGASSACCRPRSASRAEALPRHEQRAAVLFSKSTPTRQGRRRVSESWPRCAIRPRPGPCSGVGTRTIPHR